MSLDVLGDSTGVASLLDVAGGTGRTLNMIISKHPTIRGINYDLPHVVRDALAYAGITHVGGDMFSSIPAADAIMIKDTCHNWGDKDVVKVFKNIYEALPQKGKLVIIGIIIPETPKQSNASQCASGFDNSMLTLNAGRQRTAKEYEVMAKAAGFTNFTVACMWHMGGDGIFQVIEGMKAAWMYLTSSVS